MQYIYFMLLGGGRKKAVLLKDPVSNNVNPDTNVEENNKKAK